MRRTTTTISVAWYLTCRRRLRFTDWVRPHWRSMSLLAARLAASSAEDVLQDALILAWRKRDRFDPSKGAAQSWLFALTADAARKYRRKCRTTLASTSDFERLNPDIDQHIDIDAAIERLSPRQRLAVDLHYFLGLPVAEAAAVMGCSDGTVKSTLADARAKLRPFLEGNP